MVKGKYKKKNFKVGLCITVVSIVFLVLTQSQLKKVVKQEPISETG
jgi:hypothetical protein